MLTTTDVDRLSPMETTLMQTVAEEWHWTGLQPEQILQQNAFGNLLVRDRAGCYWRLCPEELNATTIATSESEYQVYIEDPDFQQDWTMDRLLEQCRRIHGSLPADHAYLFVTPPPLGGSYSADNIRIAPLQEVIGVSGSIARQVKDLPDGSAVRLTTTPKPTDNET